jgi:outer membrane protein
MRMDTLENFDIATPVLDEPSPTLESSADHVYYSALKHLPEIKSAEIRIEGSKHSLSAERGRISPQLLLRGSLGSGYSGKNGDPATIYSTGESVIGTTAGGESVTRPSFAYANSKPFSDQLSDNFNQSFGLQLNVPLFNGFNNAAAAGRAKVNYEIQKTQLEQTKIEVTETVKRAYFDAKAAGKTFVSNQKAREAAQKSFDFAEKRLEVGMMNAVEYNQIKTALTQAEAQLTRAKYDYVFKTKVLEFYQGKPLNIR